MPYPAVENANTEPCDACASPSCADKHLCDLPAFDSPEWRERVAACEAQPIDEAEARMARREIAAGWHADEVVVDSDLVSDFVMAARDGGGRFAGNRQGVELLRQGLTFAEAASAVGMPLAAFVGKFAQMPQDRLGDILKAESLLREGKHTYRAVARATGLTHQQVTRLGENLGCLSVVTANRKAGGGHKYTAAQIAMAWELRDTGLTFRQIAERCDFLKDTNAAIGIMRRNARPDDSGRGDGTVAA